MNWPVEIDWSCPAGAALDALAQAVPADRHTPILLFGSAALQMTIAPSVLSFDADISPDIVPYDPRSTEFPRPLERIELTQLVTKLQLGKGQRDLYIQVCAQGAFQPGTGYLRRIMEVRRGGFLITIPHPVDILISKLHRFEEKDFVAFQEVFKRTGFPTPDGLIAEFCASPRLFLTRDRSQDHLPSQFPESRLTQNIPLLWRRLWNREIDVEREILRPMAGGLREAYADYVATGKDRLAAIAARKDA